MMTRMPESLRESDVDDCDEQCQCDFQTSTPILRRESHESVVVEVGFVVEIEDLPLLRMSG